MKTLYDLLNVPSDADDEALNKAYRKAAKAHHPDLNAGDPNASRRFKQIATAIEILRDAEERAAYDRLVDRERQRRRSRRTTCIIVADMIAAAVVIVVLVGGYALIRPAFSTSTMVSEAEDNAVQRPVAIVAEQRTPRGERAGGDVAVVAVSEQIAVAAEPEASLKREPEERQDASRSERWLAEYEAATGSEQDGPDQVAERERPQAEREAALRPDQTCKRDSPGCGRNRSTNVASREEPKARPSAAIPGAPRSATSARRAATAPFQAIPNLLQRAGAGISGILQHCLL